MAGLVGRQDVRLILDVGGGFIGIVGGRIGGLVRAGGGGQRGYGRRDG